MSNEEAIEMLEALLDPEPYDSKLSKRAEEAVKVAIEALRERINIDTCTVCIDCQELSCDGCDPCAKCQDFSCEACHCKKEVIK